MWKLIRLILAVVVLGGITYYIIDYNKEQPEDSSIVESTKEFTGDAVEKIQEGVEKGKEMIEGEN